MNVFEEYLFEELKEEYARTDMSEEEYAELLRRFEELEHLEEVQDYLRTLRSQSYEAYRAGGQPAAERTAEQPANPRADTALPGASSSSAAPGRSSVSPTGAVSPAASVSPAGAAAGRPPGDAPLVLRDMYFFNGEIGGHMLSAAPQVQATLNFERIAGKRSVRVESRIYCEATGSERFRSDVRRVRAGGRDYCIGQACSDSYVNEFTLDPGNTWLRTSGIPMKDWNTDKVYGNYIWEMVINRRDYYYGSFQIRRGRIRNWNPGLESAALFGSAEDAAADRNASTAFTAERLGTIYVKIRHRVMNYDDLLIPIAVRISDVGSGAQAAIWEELYEIQSGAASYVLGVTPDAGRWEMGSYQYTVKYGDDEQTGVFSVL